MIQSETGADAIVKGIYKSDVLAVLGDVYQDFTTLLATKRHERVSIKNFESRFQASLSKINVHGETFKIAGFCDGIHVIGKFVCGQYAKDLCPCFLYST